MPSHASIEGLYRRREMTKKDYIYNGVYLTILVAFYLFNVEVFDYTFKEAEMCDELRETILEKSV